MVLNCVEFFIYIIFGDSEEVVGKDCDFFIFIFIYFYGFIDCRYFNYFYCKS